MTDFVEQQPTGLRAGLWWRFNRFLERHLPEGLFPRSLIIVIAPMVLLQSLMTYFVLEQHWSEVTKRLSRSVARDMAFVIATYEKTDRSAQARKDIAELANRHLKLGLSVSEEKTLPPLGQKPYFSLVEQKLSKYISNRVAKPFWIDTLTRPEYVDIRIQVDKDLVFRFLVPAERVSASSTWILLLSMIGSSLILIAVAIAFLRKQIVPIVRLADAATNFGRGREVKAFRPSGAREVKHAAVAFLEMKERIARHVEQRTAMLAGVSHDLRTILTRFRLELAFLGENAHTRALVEDVGEMQDMLHGYMAFVKGDGGEKAEPVDLCEIFAAVKKDSERQDHNVTITCAEKLLASVKPHAFKRMIVNLVSNATRFGDKVEISAEKEAGSLIITIDDDGPGIALEDRQKVFRPFVRLDQARNQDTTGTGLGLAIAQDIAHAHGGEIHLKASPLGGLRAIVKVPV